MVVVISDALKLKKEGKRKDLNECILNDSVKYFNVGILSQEIRLHWILFQQSIELFAHVFHN